LDKLILDSVNDYIKTIGMSRSKNTAGTYHNGLNVYLRILRKNGIDPEKEFDRNIKEDTIIPFIENLHRYSPATEQLYLQAVTNYFEYLSAGNLADINMVRVRLLIRQRARKPGLRLPQFPREALDTIMESLNSLPQKPVEDEQERLRNLRDIAFIFTLADTGLRVHEACKLQRGDLDIHEGKAIVIGKGNQQAVVRFSNRSIQAIRNYLSARSKLDGSSGRPLRSLPIFSRHDRGSGTKIKPITTTTGRNIINDRVEEFLGPEYAGRITPHSFRHYFVTRVLQSSSNLKLAQELARHKNIAVTQRYAHLADDELDRSYSEIFDGSN
jgi:integrase/recombinase XerC